MDHAISGRLGHSFVQQERLPELQITAKGKAQRIVALRDFRPRQVSEVLSSSEHPQANALTTKEDIT